MVAKLNSNEERKRLLKSGQMHLVHWLIVLLSILVTFLAWYYSKYQLNQKLEAKFERNAEQVVSLVKERMSLYENALWSAVAYVDASKTEINHSSWLTYSESLKINENYPGINGIGIIYNIKNEQLESYLNNQKKLRPNYVIHPFHTESEYWPITYIEPALSNKQAIGLDIAFEKNRYTSVLKARDSGQAKITAPITLVQDAKKTPGFLFYAPFYKNGTKPESILGRRESIVGVTYAPFIMKNLMQGTLEGKNRHVSIEIRDNDHILFDDQSSDSKTDFDTDPLFTKEVDMPFYGRTWSFFIQSNMQFREESATNQSTFILIGGLIIDGMLLGLFLLLSRANRNALYYADKINEEFQDKAKHLEKSNKDLEEFSYVASHDLKSPLNAIKQITQWIEEDCKEILPEQSKKHLSLLTQRSERMMKLLDDLLDYSRINRTQFEYAPVNIKSLCNDLKVLLEIPPPFIIYTSDITITVPKIPFEIVLRSLLSNAIKHHDRSSGNITLSYKCDKYFHVITIEDDGPGIPEKYHVKVFEIFETLKPRDQSEGSGMGLSIVKKIIDHYHGNITISQSNTRGTKISIFWPLSDSDEVSLTNNPIYK